ncbi:thiol reductant ABC exporter subunit CydC [Puerhibacterium puerhi]|uniref:thiol reductant ABC exporter subunit CydC n=1 Tax=Puerhibacterium puerhi TaxID=2692623 RepID=UPI0013595B51|nr:thiol reductant ABC exporter subunit CydC [Puerhibacterium puerhi]
MTPVPDPLRRLAPLLEVERRRVVRAVLLGTVALGCAVGLSAVAAWLIARASQMPPVLTLSLATVSVRAFGIGRGVFRYLERLASHDVALRGMAALRARLYEAMARGGGGVVALRRGDLLARVGADVDAVGDVVVRSLVPAGVALLVSLGSVVLVGVFLPAAGAALLACLLLAGILAPWLAARASRATEVLGAQARADVTTRALGILEEGAQLRVAGRLDAELAALRDADARLTEAGNQGARTAGAAAAIGVAAQTLAVVAALALGVPAVAAGTLAPTELAVVVLTPLAAFEASTALPAAAIQLRRSREAARRLAALLPDDAAGAAPAPAAPEPGVLLDLDGVAAGWPGPGEDAPGTTRVAVAGVDLTLRPGGVVALVGPSGVGKTTLLMTAAGLLPAAGGTVGADAPLFLAEDAHLFDTTVLENLRVARGDVTRAEARAALDAAGLGAWLAALPDGLDTLLGADATTVSGGERRRLLVARGLLARARVLLVDEPAEHLDAATADALVDALARHARATGGAVVVATHRLAAAAGADEVLLLGQSEAAPGAAGDAATGAPTAPATVVARGRHADLLRDVPAYAWAAAQEAAR